MIEGHEDVEHQDIGRQRVRQIFRYLSALNDVRNPVVRLIDEQPWLLRFGDLPEHANVQHAARYASVRTHATNGDGELDREHAVSVPTAEGEGRNEDSVVLRVRRPRLQDPPSPPEPLKDWLQRGWDQPDRDVKLLAPGDLADHHPLRRLLPPQDDPDTMTRFVRWKAERDEWAERERPARAANALFLRLRVVD